MTQGRNKNSYYNEYFLRGLPHLCKKAPRPSHVSSLNVHSKFEPDLFAISDEHPLPEEIDTLVPCGASIEMIDQGIRNHGPKGRVPLTRSRPEDDDPSPHIMPLMSGSPSQFRMIENFTQQNQSKRAKFSHHNDVVNSSKNTEGTVSSSLLSSLRQSSLTPRELMNNTNGTLEASRASFMGHNGPNSSPILSSLRSLDNSSRTHPYFSPPPQTSGTIDSSLHEQSIQLQTIIREHKAKQEHEFWSSIQQQLLQQRRKEQIRQQQQQMIVDRILRSSELPCPSTTRNGKAQNHDVLNEIIRKAMMEGALMGYTHSISKRK